jgi:hypothetical protein
MTDDIVKYLRLSQTRFNRHAEAADEIERLRALLYRWQNCEMVVDGLCGWDSKKTMCPSCKEVAAH